MHHRVSRFLGPALWTGCLAWSMTASAVEVDPAVVRIWPDGAPGAVGREDADIPTLTVYLPTKKTASGAAMVVCPGGGYGGLAIDHEGHQVARWLNSIGVAAAILKYRVAPRYRHPAPLQDAQRAIRVVRANAEDWGIDRGRVGIIGFSAGGHLASTAGTRFDPGDPSAVDPVERFGCRPDVLILGYPVIIMGAEFSHGGSQRNLLGEDAAPELVESLSNERQVTAETPPTFLVQTDEDTVVPAENSLLFVLALRRHQVPVEFHLFEKGRHGLGLGPGLPELGIGPDAAFAAWPSLCETWLRRQGFLGDRVP